MKETFKEILIEPFTEHGFSGLAFGCLMWTAILVFSSILLFPILQISNRYGREDQNGVGVVVNKIFIPEHNSSNGKTSSWTPDTWRIYVTKDGLVDYFLVRPHRYDEIEINDEICIRYYTGRLWKSLYIVSYCE